MRKQSTTTPGPLQHYILRPGGALVVAGTALPLFRSNHWLFRLCDFPRLQLSAIGALVLAAGVAAGHQRLTRGEKYLLALVGLALGAQFAQMRRYSPLASRQVIRAKDRHSDREISLLASNVLMTNRRTEKLLESIRRLQPDLVLLLETDAWWVRQMRCLREDYPYSVLQPQDNTYGMALYSRFPLESPRVRYLLRDDIPSIRTEVKLPGGQHVTLFAVHPRPPGRPDPDEGIRGTLQRDAELVVIAKEVRACTGPVIVAGDFNDVAWSHTTRRFQRLANLLDPRVGRGFFNTFHARIPLLRFPLDHLFHSEHFALCEFARLSHIGSDHFPIFARLCLSAEAPAEQEPPRATVSDHKEAREDLDAEASRTIG